MTKSTEAGTPHADEDACAEARARTIVVVDDEFSLADVIALSLSDAGFRVQSATDGVRGLELISRHRPDVVLLDYLMPLLDGPGVLRILRESEPFEAIPIVMMSSLPEATVEARCAGYAAFLHKPFTPDLLLRTVGRVLGETMDP